MEQDMDRRGAGMTGRMLMLTLVMALGANAFGDGKVVVGYYPSWNRTILPHTAVRYAHLTHIFHAFIAPTVDGGIEVPAGFLYPELIQTAHANGVKVLPSLGGWGDYSSRFSPMTADTAARRKFVGQLRTFLLANGYDGADLDYEYPKNATDRANLRSLVSELRAAFNTVEPPLLLTMAGPSTNWSGQWFDLAGMANDFDLIGIMTYDYYGSWTSKAGPNAAVYGSFSTNTEGWWDYSVDYYNLTRGVPKQKLLVGIPFYGWMFAASALYGSSTGASQLTYTSIAPKLSQGWTRSWDATGLVPYMLNGTQNQLISYDDSASVATKCAYLMTKGVGGTIIWALGQDLIGGTQPLLDVIGARLRTTGVASPADHPDVPTQWVLEQNFPNPFNPSTTIRCILPAACEMELAVFDLLGREVALLMDGQKAPGTYDVRVNAAELASGTYVYRLQAGTTVLSRTMTILR
jgi:chitinase